MYNILDNDSSKNSKHSETDSIAYEERVINNNTLKWRNIHWIKIKMLCPTILNVKDQICKLTHKLNKTDVKT